MMKAIIYTATNSITNKNKLLLAIDPMYSIIGCKLIPETTFKRGYNE
jgi:hypothetical protein